MLCARLVRKLRLDVFVVSLSTKCRSWAPTAWLVTLNEDVVRRPKSLLSDYGLIHLSPRPTAETWLCWHTQRPNVCPFHWSNISLSRVRTSTQQTYENEGYFPHLQLKKNGTARARQLADECSFHFSSPHLYPGALLKAFFLSSCECDQFTRLNGKDVRES